jgi:Uma2 family endonuclease
MPELELSIHRLTVEDVYKMEKAGIFGELDRVELLDGVLVDMTPIGPDHSDVVTWLTHHFVRGIDPPLQVRIQDMLIVEGGFLMPDLLVVDPPPRGQQPDAAHLVIEVSATSLRYDQAKAKRYASARVPEYWIIDVVGLTVTVHRQPQDEAYRDVRRLTGAASVAAAVGAPPVELPALFAQR